MKTITYKDYITNVKKRLVKNFPVHWYVEKADFFNYILGGHQPLAHNLFVLYMNNDIWIRWDIED